MVCSIYFEISAYMRSFGEEEQTIGLILLLTLKTKRPTCTECNIKTSMLFKIYCNLDIAQRAQL